MNSPIPENIIADLSRRELSRRGFVGAAGGLGLTAALDVLLPQYARSEHAGAATGIRELQPRRVNGAVGYDLKIAETPFLIEGRRRTATTINGTLPGPLLKFREGDDAVLRVNNALDEDTSLHWHGILLPPEMDGVPGVSFAGIAPQTTFEYRFRIKQYGTYWYHSHSGLQEQTGIYGPLVIEPAEGYPYQFDREHVIVLSDWTHGDPYQILSKLKKQGNYFNMQRRTVGDFVRDVRRNGFKLTLEDRMMWAEMRMDPTDLSDVTGTVLTFLMNGQAPDAGWSGFFSPGEKVLLRIINASAATYFDFRVPGLPMKVVQASGQSVQEVETDEIRIAIAETYDVIIEPGDSAYSVFAEAMDRSGFARGTLAPRAGLVASVPARRKRPVLTMADMGMDHDMAGLAMSDRGMAGHDMSAMSGAKPAADTVKSATSTTAMPGHDMSTMKTPDPTAATAMPGHDMSTMGTSKAKSDTAAMAMPGHDTSTMGSPASKDMDASRLAIAGTTWTTGLREPGTVSNPVEHEPSTHGPGNSAIPMMARNRLSEAGAGLGNDGWRVLRYTDLRALKERPDFRAPDREIEIHLTGNMERFMWSIDGIPFEDADPIHFGLGERLRLTMVNDTMMNHPMHLHGMWMELENGQGTMIPRVHTVNVKPAERLSLLVTADAPGRWAFHCHVLYHMEVGMFRVVEVSPHDHLAVRMSHGGR